MSGIVDNLMELGLTKHESVIYLSLIEQGALTGYEVAKVTGISRSNTYITLASLVDKGAAYVQEESVTKYTAVPFMEFSNNLIRKMQSLQQVILPALPERKEETHGFITIRGEENITNKLITLLEEAKLRIYISVPYDMLLNLEELLVTKIQNGIKMVILTDRIYELENATTYVTPKGDNQLRLIVDSDRIFTGHLSQSENMTCLYSQNANLVEIFKAMLQNEITLIQNNLIQPD